MKLLIAEDQSTLRNVLLQRFKDHGFVVDNVADGAQAIDFLESTTYDCCVLDIMMPVKTGLEVVRWMRQQSIQTPVLLLTAKDQIDDRVVGLNTGADDYLIKPFAFEELLARVQALLRRQNKPIQDVITVGDLEIDRQARTVHRHGVSIELTNKEFTVLEYLALHQGQVVSRDQLEMISSNYDYEGYSNVIDVYIRFLRKKIDEPFGIKSIHTVRGVGYQLKEPA